MSRALDSQLAAPQRTLVQDAFIARLQPLLIGNGGFLEAIVPISFGVEAVHLDTIDLLVNALDGRSPAIAVAPLDLHPRQAGGPGQSIGELEVQVYFLSRHRRDATEGRARADAISALDDTADPGIYMALELAWMYLFDVQLGIPTVHEPKLHVEREILTTDEQTIWHQEWRIQIGRQANMYRGLTQKIASFRTTLKQGGSDEPAAKRIVEDTDVT